jgi:putative Holliday junction resolvase
VEAKNFARLIQNIFSGPIYLVDERLSTSSAYSQMREVGKNSKESKAVIDQIAAVNILESAILNEKSGTSIGELF